MIERFLSFFSEHRILRVIARQAQEDKLRIQDHNSWLNSELQRAREELTEARREKDESLKMLANVGWQQKNGWVPWPDSGRLPQEYVASETPGPAKPDHVMGHDVLRQQNAAVLAEYLKPGTHPELRAGKATQ